MSADTALVVIDAQIGVVGEAYHHEEVLSNINLLLDRARSSGTPILYVQHHEQGGMEPGMPLWQIHPKVSPHEGEPVIRKESPDSFHETLNGFWAGERKVRVQPAREIHFAEQ